MANKKLTDLTELTTPADNDFLYVVDVSDTTESPQGTSKKIRKDKVDSGASKENIANKSDIYTTDTEKYYSAAYVNGVLPTSYSKIVYVNATSPITATIFDTENPPVTNDNLLKNDVANLYIGTDASTWVYNSTTYITKSVTATSSNFYLAGTTTDAGNTKVGHISRTGNITTTGKLGASGTSYFATNATDKAYIGTSTLNPNNSKFVIKGTVTGGTNIESILDNSGNVIFNVDNSGNTLLGATSSESNFAKLGVKGLGTDDIQAWVNSSGVLKSRINNAGSFISSSDVSASNIVASQFMAISPDKALNGNSNGSLALFSKNTYWESLGKIKYAFDYSSTYDARTLVDKGYTDAKITQTITNGVTDKSPSEDAVFDALANVTRSFVIDNIPSTTVTGTLSETILKSYLMPANTFSSTGNFKVPEFSVVKGGTAGALNIRIYVNTSNTLTGAVQIARYTATSTNVYIKIRRSYNIYAGNIYGLGFTVTNMTNDITATSGTMDNTAYNVANSYYIITTATLSSTGDSATQTSFEITN